MKSAFEVAYNSLKPKQRQAVDTTEGALMVIAGPGTGKTQLLSTRAAAIVRQGNVGAGNILCLTYTEAGATEMRQRLIRIMGPNGGDVTVHTFHSFGSWLIREYPEIFNTTRSLSPLDTLGRYRIIEGLLNALPLRHPLAVRGDQDKFVWQGAVGKGIEAFKKAGMSAEDLRRVIADNQKEYTSLRPLLTEIFGSTLSAKRLPAISELVDTELQKAEAHSYRKILLTTLQAAIQASEELGKTQPLGKWRDAHTTIQEKQRVLKSDVKQTMLSALIKIFENYQELLTKEGRFDYDDMILFAVTALSQNEDMRLDIAERFQYIMVDEYQDTNGAQNQLLDSLLQAHPTDSPNVMVVGDDEQAVMRFQGAEVSGMLRFIELYRPQLIVLEDNFRSAQAILNASRSIITQTDERLEVQLPTMELHKQLLAKNEPATVSLRHKSYGSQAAEFYAVSQQIKQLIGDGELAGTIAVIGRKHAALVDFVPYLSALNIPVNYDRRASVLEHPAIQELLDLAAYVQLLHLHPNRAAALLPTVLTAHYWGLEPLDVYRLAVASKQQDQSWIDYMLRDTTGGHLRDIAEWLIAASAEVRNSNFTRMFDILIGREALQGTTLQSSHYASYLRLQNPTEYTTMLSHLIRLRGAVLESRPTAKDLDDVLEVAAEYRRSGLELVDDNPILRGGSDAVHIMSAHSAKGREFEHVFILSAVDDMWGSRSRGGGITIALPENLPLYPAGDAESDKLRLLYVAMTRAKSDLRISSYTATDTGKAVASLGYLQLGDDPDGWWQADPQGINAQHAQPTLETSWRAEIPIDTRELGAVLEPALARFQLSVSALNSFLDIRYGGPQACLEQHVLKFPSAYSASSALGNAAHEVLRLAYSAFKAGQPLTTKRILEHFDTQLDASGLPAAELRAVRQHGRQLLPDFVNRFSRSDFSTIIASEGYLSTILPKSGVPFGGKLDAIAERGDGLCVIDYKTGKAPLPDWQTTGLSDSKKASLHFYRQQLLSYKLLIEHSAAYKNKVVSAAELVFIEAEPSDSDNQAARLTITAFEQAELERTEQLMKVVYGHLLRGDLPDVSMYSKDLKGIQAFESDLLAGSI